MTGHDIYKGALILFGTIHALQGLYFDLYKKDKPRAGYHIAWLALFVTTYGIQT